MAEMDLGDHTVRWSEEAMEMDDQEPASNHVSGSPTEPTDLPVMPLHFDRAPRAVQSGTGVTLNETVVKKHGFAIIVPSVQRPWDYVTYEEPTIEEILEEYEYEDGIYYLARFTDGNEEEIHFNDLIELENGPAALAYFHDEMSSSSDSSDPVSSLARHHQRPRRSSNSNTLSVLLLSDDEISATRSVRPTSLRQFGNSKAVQSGRSSRLQRSNSRLSLVSMSSESTSEDASQGRRRSSRNDSLRTTRNAAQKRVNYSDFAVMEDSESLESDELLHLGKRQRSTRGHRKRSPERATRKSGRSTRPWRDMREVGEDDIPEKAAANSIAKFVGARESFKQLSSNDDFRLRHCQSCDTCGGYGKSPVKGSLVYCQGCTLSFHQNCLGSRTSREHLVTKIGEGDFVLQCRRCIKISKHKEPTAPDHSKCLSCGESSVASKPFRERKSTKQEQKEREDNNGEDPISEVLPESINNANNVFFRCMVCYRSCHMHHLPPRDGSRDGNPSTDVSIDHLADERFAQYCVHWFCKDCLDAPTEVESIVAWRPVNQETYKPGATTDEVEEDAKEYLVKWKKMSYSKVKWMPGPWVWGVTAAAMRKAFAKRDNNANLPKMRTEDAIPEEYIRIDIVLDIEYTNVVNVHTVEVDQARIKEVKRAFVKLKGLGYEDVVWTEPPEAKETERWEDFKAAYNDWVMGSHIHPPSQQTVSSQCNKIRSRNFATKVKLEAQPESLTGGKLMSYQLDGLNWLYYQWYRHQNAILADEMGLGKTIQIVGFLATLKEHSCWPFLVVVPNSTCPNWRREIKQWAPSLRVVTYYGSAEARRLSLKHELFPGGGKDLRCHVVVTSYDAAQDDNFRRVFRGIRWAGLIVDEGQRLKNDKNILYDALSALKAPFKVLLTGTPLQNNPRELFNLLQFLDTSLDAKALEEEYAELTKENVPRLHEMLRPFFLRRTKAEVLTFLPSMAQIIVPVSLSTVQKKLYRSILAKNPELIKSILGAKKSLKQTERASLNNILMQLRKCLCHPFVYSGQIEERSSNPIKSHRNLVDASSKLQLLEIMLPKLQERGHRVLIFSQFLDMLDMVEDFLDGLGLYYQRLDGSMGSLQKQQRIDEFNAPDSPIFAFLLSTRAGGVGINLATADTVIILDPDFNPHQDIQALSRAHRIGQKKKVLVFQLTTRATAEEKIMQIGKKKMALDHLLIEQMDADEDAGLNLESILRHGTEALFTDDDTQDIRYDSSSVDKLLDRSQIEDTLPGKDNSAESQFSFARVWANDRGVLEEERIDGSSDNEPDPSIWENILKEREREAAEEAAAKAEDLGRGRRKRQTVDYTRQIEQGLPFESSPVNTNRLGGRSSTESDSDTDFQAPAEESDGDADMQGDEDGGRTAILELDAPMSGRPGRSVYTSQVSPLDKHDRHFRRAEMPLSIPPAVPRPDNNLPVAESNDATTGNPSRCIACTGFHQVGFCPLKMAGVEFCELCGLPHYGFSRICPHLNSVTQLRAMVEAIKQSSESREVKEAAKKRVVGIIGDLNQRKRRAKEMQERRGAQTVQPLESVGDYGVNGAYAHAGHHLNGVGIGKENRTAGPYSPYRPMPSAQ